MDKTPDLDQQKITVVLPSELLARLDAHVPARRRSRFILEAIEERLAMEEQAAALQDAAGAWSDENHPEMESEEAIDRWLASLRGSWRASE
jgi:metal-responsive CopG/Arc/MetJ family transcriptional regulator